MSNPYKAAAAAQNDAYGAKTASADPYASDPYAQDPYSSDPYAQEPANDPYANNSAPDPYSNNVSKDPYSNKGASKDPYSAPADPYANSASDPYAQAAANQAKSSHSDPYASGRALQQAPTITSTPPQPTQTQKPAMMRSNTTVPRSPSVTAADFRPRGSPQTTSSHARSLSGDLMGSGTAPLNVNKSSSIPSPKATRPPMATTPSRSATMTTGSRSAATTPGRSATMKIPSHAPSLPSLTTKPLTVSKAKAKTKDEPQEPPQDMSLHLQQLMLSTDNVQNNSFSEDFLEQLVPIVKDAIKTKRTGELLDRLDGITRLQDRKLEQLCEGGQGDYLVSMPKLSQIRSGADRQRGALQDLNFRLQQSGGQLVTRKKRLLEARTVRENLDTAIETVESCLQVLELTNKTHDLIKAKKHFAALKSLDDLQNVHLKEVSDYGFARMINDSVPQLTNLVQEDVVNDTFKWLSSLRSVYPAIGQAAFQETERLRQEWRDEVHRNPELARYKFNSPIELSYRSTSFDPIDNHSVLVELDPLYECLHIHHTLRKTDVFIKKFDEFRRSHVQNIVPTVASMTSVSEDGVAEILQNLAGFCILDRTISSRTTKGFRPQSDVDDLWISLSQKLMGTLGHELASVQDQAVLVNLKAQLGLFVQTMEQYRFDTVNVGDFLLLSFRKFSQFLISGFDKDFNTGIMEDDTNKITIHDADRYEKITRACWWTPEDDEAAGGKPGAATDGVFPKTLPFSPILPLCCAKITHLIHQHYAFLDEFNVSEVTQTEDYVQQAMDSLLNDIICDTLLHRLMTTTREQIVQILIDLQQFERVIPYIAQSIVDGRPSQRKSKITLKAQKKFSQASTKAESRIFEHVTQTVDNFMELEDYDWSTTVSSDEPSSYLDEMVNFLTIFFNSTLADLPFAIKNYVYFGAFDHLASSLLQILLNAPRGLITTEAVHNYNIDIQYMEKFVNTLHLDGGNASLSTTFIEIRQCLDLLMTNELSKEYNNPQIRMRRYDRIKPEVAQQLMDMSQTMKQPQSPQIGGNAQQKPTSRFMRMYRNASGAHEP
ncbi:Exocyst complex component 6 [Yarrowia sp. C11]|nr:Exocyst complex component 6 [Yarrowia sp. C11]KAG5364560.1 Exocyst complex component 6 [Yarrowia sp. E02]